MSGIISTAFRRKSSYKEVNNTSVYGKRLKNNDLILSESTQLKEAIGRKSRFHNGLSNNIMNENTQQALLEDVYVRGTERAFGFFLCEAYYQSLVMDNDFKLKNENQIRSFFIEKLKEDANGDVYQYMKECSKKSGLLNKLVESCKHEGSKLKDKAAKKIEEETDEFDIDNYLNDEGNEEAMKIDYDKADVTEISNVVKEKVVQVIKDEEERNKQSQAFIEDINSAKSVNESSCIFHEGVEEFSLFKSMMMKNYKETIHAMKNNMVSESVYGKINENNEININMDYVMCDAILEYTNLELMNTMKIKSYTPSEIRKVAEQYAYSKIE